jgi:hypothetical protein
MGVNHVIVDWPLTFSALADVSQIAAVGIGGIWTYRLFVRQRLAQERANVKHTVDQRVLNENSRLVRVLIELENIGSVILRPPKGETSVQQVLPIEAEIAQVLAGGNEPIENGATEFDWPVIATREYDLKADDVSLEPGEVERLLCDFIIPIDVRTIEVHTVVFCSSRANAQFWDETTLHDLPEWSSRNGEVEGPD